MMALVMGDGCWCTLSFCQEGEGALIATANNALDGVTKYATASTSIIPTGRSLICRALPAIRLRLLPFVAICLVLYLLLVYL